MENIGKPAPFRGGKKGTASSSLPVLDGNGWEWMGMDGLLGVAGMIIDSDEMDHSRKFPTFSTSK